MTFLNANLPSEDEEDEDYVASEVDEDEPAAKKPAKKRKAMRGAAIGAAAVDDHDEEDEEAEKDAHDDIPEHKKAEKKAKMDELWSSLNTNAAAPTAKPAASINLAALCKPVQKKKASVDQSWQRQLGLTKKVSKDSEKSAIDKKAAAASALAAAKVAASATAAQQYGMVSVTETRRFAGQNITMTKQVAADSKEATNNGQADATANKKQAGLDAVLASLAQAKKVGVLDKSRADWKDFKKVNETVDEELEVHKRSGEGFLEKQAFLSKAELKEYEKERDARLQSDVRNRGRL